MSAIMAAYFLGVWAGFLGGSLLWILVGRKIEWRRQSRIKADIEIAESRLRRQAE